jgi:hypothetical protein
MKTLSEQDLHALNKEELINLTKKQQKEIYNQHHLLKETFKSNQLLINKLKDLENGVDECAQSDRYNPALSWVSKIVYTLRTQDRPLRSPEMISLLEKREPLLAAHHNKVQYFSAFLSNAVGYERILQRKVKGVRGYYYLLPEWLDETGLVRSPFKEMMI